MMKNCTLIEHRGAEENRIEFWAHSLNDAKAGAIRRTRAGSLLSLTYHNAYTDVVYKLKHDDLSGWNDGDCE